MVTCPFWLSALPPLLAWNTDVLAGAQAAIGKCEDEGQALSTAEWKAGKSQHGG